MTDGRKLELFEEMIDYLCSCDSERCIEILNSLSITKQEANDLEFFDFIVDNIKEDKNEK